MRNSYISAILSASLLMGGLQLPLVAQQMPDKPEATKAATVDKPDEQPAGNESQAATSSSEAANSGTKARSKIEQQESQMMHGYVSTTKSQDEIAGCIDEALSAAIRDSIEAQAKEKAVEKHNRRIMRVWRGTKAAVNFMLCDRGFGPSMEGGKLELDEQLKVRDRFSAECAKQLWLDKTHDAIVENIVEMVTGLGTNDANRRQHLINDGLTSLKTIVGDSCANHVLDRLTSWSDKESVQSATAAFDNQQPLSIKERQEDVDMIVKAVSKDDPIVGDVVNKVHKYTKHSKASVVTSQVVETSLNVASLTPNFVAPAASALLLVFFLATGGPEEDKLLSEMYLGKRLQSRKTSLNNQAGMAIDAYELAMSTHNVPLLMCSESLVKRLAGNDVCSTICHNGATGLSTVAGNGGMPAVPVPVPSTLH